MPSRTTTTTGIPSYQERQDYFRGLGPSPLLIARTGNDQWPPTQHPKDTPLPRKLFDTIQDRDMVSKWTLGVVEGLIENLEGIDWVHFYPVRIRYEQWPGMPNLPNNLVLLVGVNRRSYPSHPYQDDGSDLTKAQRKALITASKAAHRCKRSLESFGIMIDVEMYETDWNLYSKSHRPILSESHLAREHWTRVIPGLQGDPAEVINGIVSPLLPISVSYPIYSKETGLQGTMGLHIRLEGSDKVYGLTCRHVVLSDKRTPHSLDYQCNDTKETLGKRAIGLPDRTMKLAANKLARVIIATNGSNVAEYARRLKSAVSKTMEVKPDLGSVALAPAVEGDVHGFLKDWALIELEGNELRDLQNLDNSIWANTDGHRTWIGREFDVDSAGFLQLQGVTPVQELLFGESMEVAMRGGATNKMTYGMTNEIPAITRIPKTKRGRVISEQYAFQLMVVPPHEGCSGLKYKRWSRHDFALPGDSGTVVFDGRGSVIGLVGGGAMGPGVRSASHCKEHITIEDRENCLLCDLSTGHDITFVNPMEHILSDIEKSTGKHPIIIGVEKQDLWDRRISEWMCSVEGDVSEG